MCKFSISRNLFSCAQFLFCWTHFLTFWERNTSWGQVRNFGRISILCTEWWGRLSRISAVFCKALVTQVTRFKCSGMWHHVDWWILIDIAEELACISRKINFLDCIDPEDGGSKLYWNITNLTSQHGIIYILINIALRTSFIALCFPLC